jgi:hypothetical protein
MQSGTSGWSGLAVRVRVGRVLYSSRLPHRRASDVGVDLSEVEGQGRRLGFVVGFFGGGWVAASVQTRRLLISFFGLGSSSFSYRPCFGLIYR